jgi:hypothetical protein
MSSFTESPKRSSHDDTVLAAADAPRTTCSGAKPVVTRPLFAAELAEGASVRIGALIAEPRGFLCFSANASVVPIGTNEWPMAEESLQQVTSKIN